MRFTQGYEPDAACCARVADAAHRAGDRASTVKYCAEAERLGLKASDATLAFAAGRHYGVEYEEGIGDDGEDASDASTLAEGMV